MSYDKVHLRHCILYEYEQGRNSVEATQNLKKVFGEDAVYEEDGLKNSKLVIPTFPISHVPEDSPW